MTGLTPMLRQFYDIKEQCPGCILFFRVGDFYETYGEDAEISARELGITLTSREVGDKRIPMAGVPFHSVDPYLFKMIRKGFKVAICEQMEDPKYAKGLVKRDIVRIVTSGTVVESKLLEENQNNYLVSVVFSDKGQAIALADISTGEFKVSFIGDNTGEVLKGEMARLKPSECLLPEEDGRYEQFKLHLKDLSVNVTLKPAAYFDINEAQEKLVTHFGKTFLNTKPFNTDTEILQAAGAILFYLEETRMAVLSSISRIESYEISDYMVLDHRTRKNLELTANMRDGKKYGTLLWILDKTRTPMGGRKLRQWIEQPLMKTSLIKARLDAVDEFYNSFSLREKTREKLKEIRDLERLFMRIAYGTASARDLIAVKKTLEVLPEIKNILSGVTSEFLKKLLEDIKELEEIKSLVENSIYDDPPLSLKEGNLIKKGFNSEVDELRVHRYDGKQWIADLETQERERTGIKSLKVRYNKVFGYFIEVTNANKHLVP